MMKWKVTRAPRCASVDRSMDYLKKLESLPYPAPSESSDCGVKKQRKTKKDDVPLSDNRKQAQQQTTDINRKPSFVASDCINLKGIFGISKDKSESDSLTVINGERRRSRSEIRGSSADRLSVAYHMSPFNGHPEPGRNIHEESPEERPRNAWIRGRRREREPKKDIQVDRKTSEVIINTRKPTPLPKYDLASKGKENKDVNNSISTEICDKPKESSDPGGKVRKSRKKRIAPKPLIRPSLFEDDGIKLKMELHNIMEDNDNNNNLSESEISRNATPKPNSVIKVCAEVHSPQDSADGHFGLDATGEDIVESHVKSPPVIDEPDYTPMNSSDEADKTLRKKRPSLQLTTHGITICEEAIEDAKFHAELSLTLSEIDLLECSPHDQSGDTLVDVTDVQSEEGDQGLLTKDHPRNKSPSIVDSNHSPPRKKLASQQNMKVEVVSRNEPPSPEFVIKKSFVLTVAQQKEGFRSLCANREPLYKPKKDNNQQISVTFLCPDSATAFVEDTKHLKLRSVSAPPKQMLVEGLFNLQSHRSSSKDRRHKERSSSRRKAQKAKKKETESCLPQAVIDELSRVLEDRNQAPGDRHDRFGEMDHQGLHILKISSDEI